MEKVTLYVPCYNAEKYLEQCLQAIMKQTYPIAEILIIDDGSTDRTVEIASEYSVRIIKHGGNKGLAAARNTAFKRAGNEFVASLDADCIAEPDWLERLMENFTNENIAGVGGKLLEKYTDTLADKWRAVHMKQQWGDEKLTNPDFLFGSNNVFRRKAVEDVGYYNEKYRTNCEDVDLCKRLREKNHNLVYQPGAVAIHLKRDSLSSVLEMAWRWGHPNQTSLEGKRDIFFRIVGTLIFSGFLLIKDIKRRNFSLTFVDALRGLYNSKKYVQIYRKSSRQSGNAH